MANFKQHLSFGCIGTGLFVAPLVSSGIVNLAQASMLWLCGMITSILPDIDSDNAVALDMLFSMLTLIAIYTLLNHFGVHKSALEIMGLVIGTFMLITAIRILFEKMTVHRGIFHSLLAACVIALATSVITFHFYHLPAQVAWLASLFSFLGYCLHLLLDEIYSVDFMNTRIKRSFGSAMKLTHFKNVKGNLGFMIVAGILWYFTPPTHTFFKFITNGHTYQHLWNHLLPKALVGI